MIDAPGHHLASFYIPWLAAAAASADLPGDESGFVIVDVGGIALPVVRLALAVAGVLLARLVAPRGDPPMSLGKALVVTVIMLLLACTWVIDDRPSLIFTFVVSIGLGFSGYSVIELAGSEIRDTVKAAGTAIRTKISKLTGTDE